MEKVTIKNTDLLVSRINFGGNVFGWTLDEKQSFDMLDQLRDHAINFVDTADTYAWWVNGRGGQSETIIGNWLKDRGARDKMVIATKVGSETKEHGFDIRKEHILRSADESLKRLKSDYIDLYYTHFDDKVTPVEETLAAYDTLIKAGKVRYIAASNVSPERLAASFEAANENNYPRYVALQPHYNLVERANYESQYAPLVEKYQLSVMPYWSLAAGFLTGKYRSEADVHLSARGAGAKKYFTEKGFDVLAKLDQLAAKHETQQATVALAWLLTQPAISSAIVSATNGRQLQTLIAAPALSLDAEDLSLLNE